MILISIQHFSGQVKLKARVFKYLQYHYTYTNVYFMLAREKEGVQSGFKYKNVPHLTLKSIANNEPAAQEILYDQPVLDKSKIRITGPFTMEAVPAPVVKPIEDIKVELAADLSVARTGETARQYDWQEELSKTGKCY